VISTRATAHPACPPVSRTHRVTDYTSVLAARPASTPDKPGIQFSLRVLEDPGVSLPDSLISWVAVRAMPEFLSNLRAACLKLRGRVGSVLPTPDLLQQRALTSQFSILSCTEEEEEVDLSRKAEYETDWIDQLLKDEIAELEPDPAEPVVVVESKNTDSEREPESTESRQGKAICTFILYFFCTYNNLLFS